MLVSIEQAQKVYDLVGAGLVSGLGQPVPGQMCVEAAICLAMGDAWGDTPTCVGDADRQFSITLNDTTWSSPEARAKGMRSLSIAQLGSAELSAAQTLEWVRLLSLGVVNRIVPIALRAAAAIHPDQKHRQALEIAAVECSNSAADSAYGAARSAADSARSAADSAYWARSAADWAAKRDEVLTIMADIAVDAYRQIQAPGIALLDALVPRG